MVVVVKIGGSLFPDYVDDICEVLCESNEDVVLVSGGGRLANSLREFNSVKTFSDDVNHWSAIKCMDILGELIADRNESVVAVNDIESISRVHECGKIPLLLVYDLMRSLDPLKHSWDVTSDSIACWLAHRINAKLLILTNVDGIYSGNISSNNKKLVKRISANKLLIFEETCVDKCLPKLLIKYNLSCFVVNGMYPGRVLDHLNGDNKLIKCTYIGGK